jgi:hypothetical protein
LLPRFLPIIVIIGALAFEPRAAQRRYSWVLGCRGFGVGEAIEFGEGDLSHFDAEAVLQPLGSKVAVAPDSARVAIVVFFPAKHHWNVPVAEELVTDCAGVEAAEDLSIACQILLRGDRFKPWPWFELVQAVVAAFAAWDTAANPDWNCPSG